MDYTWWNVFSLRNIKLHVKNSIFIYFTFFKAHTVRRLRINVLQVTNHLFVDLYYQHHCASLILSKTIAPECVPIQHVPVVMTNAWMVVYLTLLPVLANVWLTIMELFVKTIHHVATFWPARILAPSTQTLAYANAYQATSEAYKLLIIWSNKSGNGFFRSLLTYIPYILRISL